MKKIKDSRAFMRNFFERLYEKEAASSNGIQKLNLGEKDKTMWLDPECREEFKQWKLTEATVTERDVIITLSAMGCTLPECLVSFFTVYHHYFQDPVGIHPVSNPFAGLESAWNPTLAKAYFLPLAWSRDSSCTIFIDLKNTPDPYRCPVGQIKLEALREIAENLDDGDYGSGFEYYNIADEDKDWDEDYDPEAEHEQGQVVVASIREAVLNNMEELAPDFYTYLNNMLDD